MARYEVDIKDPKVVRLLQDLADLDLIAFKKQPDENFLEVVERIRGKAGNNPPSLEEITQEVEFVRSQRYANRKG